MRKLGCILALCALVLTTGCASQSQASVNNSANTSGVYIQNKGSDTLVNLALAWAETYQNLHPDIEISVTGGGSGTGFTSLINGTVDIANASRQIKAEEVQQAKDKGFKPVEFTVANDAIAVIVNPANPVSQLTLEQAALFLSKKLGFRGQVVLLPYAEMGMDVDKDFQFEIMQEDLLKGKI